MRLRGQETSAEAWLTGTRCIPYAILLCDVMSSLCTYCMRGRRCSWHTGSGRRRAVWLYLYAYHWHGLARFSLFLSREKVCSARNPGARLVGTAGHAIRYEFSKSGTSPQSGRACQPEISGSRWSQELELALTSHHVDAISETTSQSLRSFGSRLCLTVQENRSYGSADTEKMMSIFNKHQMQCNDDRLNVCSISTTSTQLKKPRAHVVLKRRNPQ
jgi:hypothetical protein